MKRLAICCDGTWNTPGQTDRGIPAPTNVTKLYNAVAEHGADGIEQKKYYHPGVGTDPGWRSKLFGGGLGKGLDNNIKSAYRFLADHYASGDEIYLFGFSRGAYTVRSLGGLVSGFGILDTTDLSEAEIWGRIDKLYDDGYRRGRTHVGNAWAFRPPPQGEEKIPIRFIGVWDTVGALGIPDDLGLLNLLDRKHDYTFHDTMLGKNTQTARHAIAMDERRASFQPTLWTNVEGRDVKQLWFPGVHSDVGGGYAHAGLSDGALAWMIGEAGGQGQPGSGEAPAPALAFDEALLRQLRPDHHAILHDSLASGFFSLLPTQPRSIPCLPQGPDLHTSAISRHTDPPITQAPYRATRTLASGEEIALDIFAAQFWNDTGLYLEADATYDMVATGEWRDASIVCGPDGADGRNWAHRIGSVLGRAELWLRRKANNASANVFMTRRHEEYPWFCLVGAIANGRGVDDDEVIAAHETQRIGTKLRWTPEASGYFYAYANDAWRFYKNNSGRLRLTVKRL